MLALKTKQKSDGLRGFETPTNVEENRSGVLGRCLAEAQKRKTLPPQMWHWFEGLLLRALWDFSAFLSLFAFLFFWTPQRVAHRSLLLLTFNHQSRRMIVLLASRHWIREEKYENRFCYMNILEKCGGSGRDCDIFIERVPRRKSRLKSLPI